jgi:hypothetical protein
MFNLKKLNELEGNKKNCVEVSNGFAALGEFDAEVDINSAWKKNGQHITTLAKESLGYYKLKKHKP